MFSYDNLIQELGGLCPIGSPNFIAMSKPELKVIENLVGCSLPSEYVSIITEYGACTFNAIVEVRPITPLPHHISDGNVFVGSFYGPSGLSPHDAKSLLRAIKTFRDRMPETVIPIMSCSGNLICIGVKGKEKNKVYYWDRENEWDETDYFEDYGKKMPARLKFQNLHLLANSFDDFMKRLVVNNSL